MTDRVRVFRDGEEVHDAKVLSHGHLGYTINHENKPVVSVMLSPGYSITITKESEIREDG